MSRAITITVRGSQGSGKTALLKLIAHSVGLFGKLTRFENDATKESALIVINDPEALAKAVSTHRLDTERGAAMCKSCGQTFPTAMEHDCPGLQPKQTELKDDPAFRAGRELLIEGGEKAIDMILSGKFYEDYDASSEALGDLRSLLDVVKDTLK